MARRHQQVTGRRAMPATSFTSLAPLTWGEGRGSEGDSCESHCGTAMTSRPVVIHGLDPWIHAKGRTDRRVVHDVRSATAKSTLSSASTMDPRDKHESDSGRSRWRTAMTSRPIVIHGLDPWIHAQGRTGRRVVHDVRSAAFMSRSSAASRMDPRDKHEGDSRERHCGTATTSLSVVILGLDPRIHLKGQTDQDVPHDVTSAARMLAATA